MGSLRLAGGCGLILTTVFCLAPLEADPPLLPLPQAQKDKIKQCLCLNQHWLPHSQPACNKHCIPPGEYAEASPSQTVATLPGTTPIEVGKKDAVKTDSAVPPVAEEGKILTNIKEALNRKTFRLSAPNIQVDHISLDQVALAIYDTGKVAFSGRLFNQGGKQKELLGNNVKVTLRAYAGQNNEGTPLTLPRAEGPVGGPMVWQASLPAKWLLARNPESIILSLPAVTEIRNHFSEITGFDVTLAYDKGR